MAHWFVSCIDCIKHPITTRYRRSDEVFCSAYIKIASPLPTSPLRELHLKMDRPKRKGGAEKLWEKRIKSLEADAAKCAKITDMFTAAVASTSTAVPKYVQQQEPEQVPSHDEQACCSVVSDEGQSRDKEEEEEKEKRELNW